MPPSDAAPPATRSSRPGYPISLDLTGRRALVVGGGPVAARRARGLLDAGAVVDVVAPQLCDEMSRQVAELTRAGRVRWHDRGFRPDDLTDPGRAWFVHVATGVRATDDQVSRRCEELGIWCVRADDAQASAAWTPAVLRGRDGGPHEGITVAVTGGGDPGRAVALRNAIRDVLVAGRLPVARTRGVGEQTEGRGSTMGRVWLVGGGPGDSDLITVRGRDLLESADVVVADRLGPRELLETLRPEVEVIDVGKAPGHHLVRQEQINELLVTHARAGRRVVRLKGGDPFVLGRGGEEAVYCAEHGVPVEVVPGVTSAISVPAAAGIPITHRGITASFVVASGHDDGQSAVAALHEAPAGATLVLLMGIATLGRTADRLIEAGRSPDTPVALVESGWTPAQRTTVTTLAKAAAVAEQEDVRSPAVVVIGDVVTVRSVVGDLHGR